MQAQLLLRSLDYDRAIKNRTSTGEVVVGILYKPGSAASPPCEREMAEALTSAAKDMTVAGLRVTAATVALPKTGDVADELKRARAQAVYLCAGLDSELGRVTTATRGAATLSFTANESYIKDGVAVGLVVRGERPAIVVNITAAQAEGADLASTFLRIVEIIR